jgi:hypothetical protein
MISTKLRMNTNVLISSKIQKAVISILVTISTLVDNKTYTSIF